MRAIAREASAATAQGRRAMKRLGSAAWSGNLRDGKGSVSTESHALDSNPHTYFRRYGEKLGTDPESTAAGLLLAALSFSTLV
jgi:lipoyl-dependent peroxiredoxin